MRSWATARMQSADTGSLSPELQQWLIRIARQSIVYGMDHQHFLPIDVDECPARLRAHQGCFVTLTLRGQLRGCIGNIDPDRLLAEAVSANAYAAAVADPRFRPLPRAELPLIKIHLSLLTPSTEMQFDSEADLLRQLCPAVDGLVIQQDGRRATFLPSVWHSLPKPEDFLSHLKRKAGIPEQGGAGTLKAWRYTVESISE